SVYGTLSRLEPGNDVGARMTGAESLHHVPDHAIVVRVTRNALLDVTHLAGTHLVEELRVVHLVVETDEIGSRLEQQVDVALVVGGCNGEAQPVVGERVFERP